MKNIISGQTSQFSPKFHFLKNKNVKALKKELNAKQLKCCCEILNEDLEGLQKFVEVSYKKYSRRTT